MPDHRISLSLEPGQMKTVLAGEQEVLVGRVGDRYFAVEPTCSHYGAPLVDGALVGDRIVCPWHHACFHGPTGRQLEPPGRDGLAHFPIRPDGDAFIVTVPDPFDSHPAPEMVTADPDDLRTIAILGGGTAGLHAAQELRTAGFEGRIFMITCSIHPPHDRTMLSKAYLRDEREGEWLVLRDAHFFDDHRIALWLNKRVMRVEADRRKLHFDDGSSFEADVLILATGGIPRTLNVPGEDLQGVFTLRDTPDADAIRTLAGQSTRAVVVGSGFIGMEAAASLRQLGLDVTIVARDAVPFTRALGERVGQRVLAEHLQHGVRFMGQQTVEAFQGDRHVEGVRLSTGEVLPADLVLVAVGIRPATRGFHGLHLADDGGVEVDEYLQAAEGVFAAGDIAAFPLSRTGERVRIEHWRVAAQHGRYAARNAAGKPEVYDGVPFFWTAHFDLNLRYVGHAEDWDEMVVDGDVEKGSFIAYYVKGGQVAAACGVGRDTEMAALQELLRRDALPPLEALRDGTADLLEQARQLEPEAMAG